MMRWVTTIVAVWLLVLPVGAADFEIPFKVYGKRHAILVQLAVNGKNRTFLLDTGSARTVMSPATVGASEFNLRLTRFRDRGPGATGEAMRGIASSLRLGKRVWYDRAVVVMNLKEVSRIYGHRIDGLLGQDILTEFTLVVIDFKNRKIVFTR